MPTKTDRRDWHQLFPYSYKVPGNVDGMLFLNKKDFGPLYGVELEVSTSAHIQDIVDATPDVFACCKQDSSITGCFASNMEIVTRPASLKAHRFMWANIFSKIPADKFDMNDRLTNGLHIHIERLSFDSEAHIKNFCAFMGHSALSLFHSVLSRRDNFLNNQYCRSPNVEFDKKARMLKNNYDTLRSNGHTSAINVSNSATVEVRIFYGLPTYSNVMSSLEYVDSVLEFSKFLNKQTLNNLLEDYRTFLNNTPKNKYRFIKRYLKIIDFDTHVVVSRLLTLKKSELTDVEEGILEKFFKSNPKVKFSDRVHKLFNKVKGGDAFFKIGYDGAIRIKDNGIPSIVGDPLESSEIERILRTA